MRPLRFFGPGIVLLGLLVLALAVQRGEARIYLVVVIPVVAATGPVAFLAILLVFVGFFLTFLLWPSHLQPHGDRPVETLPTPVENVPTARRWGGVVFLGPIPLVFGSDPRMTRMMLFVGVILFFGLLALTVFALLW